MTDTATIPTPLKTPAPLPASGGGGGREGGLWSRPQVAARLGVSPRTLNTWLSLGEFPDPIPLPGGMKRWEPAAVEAWLDEKRMSTTDRWNDKARRGRAKGAAA